MLAEGVVQAARAEGEVIFDNGPADTQINGPASQLNPPVAASAGGHAVQGL